VPTPLARLGLWFRVVVTVVVLTLVLRTVDWSEFAGLPGRLHQPTLLLAAICMGLAYPLHAVRLGFLLRQQGVGLSFGELHRITWISIFFGSFTPGGIGGDVSRLLHVYGRIPDNKPGGTAAVLADRVVGLATLLFLAAAAAGVHLWTSSAPSPEIRAIAPLLAASFPALGLGWVLLARRRPAGRFAAHAAAARQTLDRWPGPWAGPSVSWRSVWPWPSPTPWRRCR
jgi:uncharacterized membrane protein YbhN (UPF0104 family)